MTLHQVTLLMSTGVNSVRVGTIWHVYTYIYSHICTLRINYIYKHSLKLNVSRSSQERGNRKRGRSKEGVGRENMEEEGSKASQEAKGGGAESRRARGRIMR